MSTNVLQKPEKKEAKQLSAGRIEELIEEPVSISKEDYINGLKNPGNQDQEAWNRFANGEPSAKVNDEALNEILPQPGNVDPTTKQLGETAVEATNQH